MPTRGAISHVRFETHTGQSLLVRSTMANGDQLPLGANIFSAAGKNSGTVGTNGDIYISGASEGDLLTAKWGEDASENCSLLVPVLKAMDEHTMGYQEISLTCLKP